MSKDLYIQDTAKVYFTSLATGNIVGVGYAQTAGIEGSTEETDVRGGVGNKLAYTIRSSKDLTLAVTSATFKPEFLALTQGTEEVANASAEVTDSFLAVVGDTGKITIPADLGTLTTVRVEDLDGSQKDYSVTSNSVSLEMGAKAKKGDTVEVFYLKTIEGTSFDFNATKHGGKVKVEYTVLCYDRKTATPHSDLHFVFPECVPSGNFSMSFTNGEAYTPELNFKVTAPENSDVLGTKYETLRK